jgi:type I restriction enzyme R subunit
MPIFMRDRPSEVDALVGINNPGGGNPIPGVRHPGDGHGHGSGPGPVSHRVVDLSHQRVQKTGEHDLALTAEGAVELPGFGNGSGGAKEQEKSPLSELIEKFIKRFGTDFTEQDVITPFAEAKADPKVRAAAVNDEEDFGLVFDAVFEDKMIEHIDTIADMGCQYFSHDDSFKQTLNRSARRAAYQDDPPRGEHLR